MIEVWLLMVAILGAEPRDIRFYRPRVEFPTEASCRRQADQVRRDYTDDAHQVVTACAAPRLARRNRRSLVIRLAPAVRGALGRGGSLFCVGALLSIGSLVSLGALISIGSLADYGTLQRPGSLADVGTLRFAGSLSGVGALR